MAKLKGATLVSQIEQPSDDDTFGDTFDDRFDDTSEDSFCPRESYPLCEARRFRPRQLASISSLCGRNALYS